MKTLLHIDSSARPDSSVSRELSAEAVAHWLHHHPEYRVVTRDLAAEPLPHFDADMALAYFTAAEHHDDAQARAIARSDKLVDELVAADVIVIGAPMYNFGIPSTLKAWVDHVARAGRTFRYTDQGPQGLLTGRKAIIASARGGQYTGSPLDHQETYLQTVLNFLGIEDIDIITAEGLAVSAVDNGQAIANAKQHVRQLATA